MSVWNVEEMRKGREDRHHTKVPVPQGPNIHTTRGTRSWAGSDDSRIDWKTPGCFVHVGFGTRGHSTLYPLKKKERWPKLPLINGQTFVKSEWGFEWDSYGFNIDEQLRLHSYSLDRLISYFETQIVVKQVDRYYPILWVCFINFLKGLKCDSVEC